MVKCKIYFASWSIAYERSPRDVELEIIDAEKALWSWNLKVKSSTLGGCSSSGCMEHEILQIEAKCFYRMSPAADDLL